MMRAQHLMTIAAAGAGLALSTTVMAGLTAGDIFGVIKPGERQRLEAGEIITVARPAQESDDSGLAIGLAVIVPAALDKTLATLQTLSINDDPGQRRITRVISGPVPGDGTSKAFAAVAFAADEGAEVQKLLRAEPGNDFNFSAQELAWVRAAANGSDPAQAAASVMRRVLESRYLAYRKAGLAGMPPYARGSEQTRPGDELAASADALPVVRARLPGFFQAYRHFPKGGRPDIEHRFLWEKKTTEGRPMFSLRHELTHIRPDGATIGSREYYMNNTLSTYQVIIALIPYGEQTLAVLINETYTDQVAGAKRFVAARIGRSIVETNTKPLFEKLQKALGRARPVR